MCTKIIRRLGGMLAVAFFCFSTAVADKTPPLEIFEAYIDFEAETITLFGANFDNGQMPVVTMGLLGPVDVDSYSGTQIILDFSDGGLPEAGDYRVVVTTGQGNDRTDTYDLTVYSLSVNLVAELCALYDLTSNEPPESLNCDSGEPPGGGQCGDGVCDVSSEDSVSCPSDCSCGDGVCDNSEDSVSCPTDCSQPKPNGFTCVTSSECASGFCTDGYCCETSCDSACDACDLPGDIGSCVILPEGYECQFGGGTCDGISASCPASCEPGFENCGGSCVNTDTDASHCGGCGQICAPGEFCVAGECALSP